MNVVEDIISKKKWIVSTQVKDRLMSMIRQFNKDQTEEGYLFYDIEQFSSYFVTYVYKIIYRKEKESVSYYVKLAALSDGFETRQRERIKYEYDYTVKVANIFKEFDQFSSVLPIAYFEDEAAFIMEEMSGERLDTMIVSSMKIFPRKPPQKLYQSMFNAGKWLKLFQDNMPFEGDNLYTKINLKKRIDVRLDKVEDESPNVISVALANKIRDKSNFLIDNFRTSDLEKTAKHNDFAPWNLMGTPDGMTGFDFADCEFDSKFYDVSHFMRAVNSFKLKPIKNVRIIDKCKECFLEGYGLDLEDSVSLQHYFNLFFSLERVQMLLRQKNRHAGLVGLLRTFFIERHIRWYLKEIIDLTK